VATTVALAAGGGGTPAWQPGVLAAERFAATRRGTVAFSVRTACGAWGRRQDAGVPSASVLKAMLLVADLRRPQLHDRPLPAAHRRLLGPMIRRSSNGGRATLRGMFARLMRGLAGAPRVC
jgi:hypothetical protein